MVGDMMDNYNMSVTSVEGDRISNLPEHLIDSILERAPFEDAVKTSILSKKWRYKWTTMKVLVFDAHFSKKYAKTGAFGPNGFTKIITQVLTLQKGPILKFHLHIPSISLDSFQEVDQCMLLLSRKGVTDLVLINNSKERYELPSHVFSCLELKKLELDKFLFKPPLEFKGFPNLEEVCLVNIDFGANLWGTEINLPQLKELMMVVCINVQNFNIKATKLQSLQVCKFPDVMLLQLMHSPYLTRAHICFRKPTEDFVRVERMTFSMMLSNLPNIKHFCINNHFLKIFTAENIPKWLPHPLNNLEHLRLRSFQLGDLDQLNRALCLLRNSPNLKELYIIQEETEPVVDVGPASNHLESPNCLDCILSQLETVEIIYIEGSGPELLFIKLLLVHSPSLKKFTIRPNGDSDAQNIPNIAKDVMKFPRASPKAEMIYLNP